jgi:transposase-like protein
MPNLLLPERRAVNGRALFLQEVSETQAFLDHLMSQRLTLRLNQAVDQLLGRSRYERRAHVPYDWEQVGACVRCGSHRCDHFSRNGSRPRTVTFLDFQAHLRLPRVVCQCGGSVRLNFDGLLRPYQRLGDDVDAQIRRWAQQRLSLREMQAELAHSRVGSLGWRTLNARLHQVRELTPDLDASQVPPILQLDAIWFTQLQATDEIRTDRRGRRRTVKQGHKRPLFIALGVWPATGRREVLAWQLGASEEAAAWLTFLSDLEAQGIRGEHGLRLIIHDGGSGLGAALQTVDFDAAQQRCLFHKLRNIADALQLDPQLTPKQRRRQRRAILKDFAAIWDSQDYATALRRYLRVCRQYRHDQPAAVATLRRDFRSTVTYYQLEDQHPTWPRPCRRTTSYLERLNRRFRRRIRAANAYHSDDGVLAMIAQEADQAFRPGRTRLHKPAT